MNKKILTYGIIGLFALALVSAALVTFYAQTEVNMNIESPIVLNGNLSSSVNLIAGNGYNLYLVSGTNRLNKSLNVNAKVVLEYQNGTIVTNTDGFNLAYTDDVSYAYNSSYGNCSNWTCAESWMNNNADWLDWALNGDLSKFNSTIITNYQGNSAFPNAIKFNKNLPMTLEPGNFYAVLYVDVDSAVVPNNYTMKVQLLPTA